MNTPQPTYRGQWVSVKERLPENNTKVMVIKQGIPFDELERLVLNREFYVSPSIKGNQDITHWLELYPLPPVPEKE